MDMEYFILIFACAFFFGMAKVYHLSIYIWTPIPIVLFFLFSFISAFFLSNINQGIFAFLLFLATALMRFLGDPKKNNDDKNDVTFYDDILDV